jgi:hypothetical protein
MIKKVGPETSHTASTWLVQPIYMMKKDGPETPTAYIHDEKCCSRDFPYSLCMAPTADT